MTVFTCFLFVLALFLLNGCTLHRSPPASPPPEPPRAAVRPTRLEKHGHVRVDDYYWLNRRGDPEVIAYLEAENAYTEAVTAPWKGLRETLFGEIKGRMKPDEASVPYAKDGWFYYTRYEKGKEYPLYCRRKGSLEAPEEILLDGNRMAKGHGFFALRGVTPSPGGDLLAYSVDTRGRRIYTLHVKNLATGEILPEAIRGVTGNVAWANDDRTLFYAAKDLQTLRSCRILRHTVGEDPARDTLVYEEKDDTFTVHLEKARSRKYIFIVSSQTLTDEVRYLDADDPAGAVQVFLPRERGHEYSVVHGGDRFYVRTNRGAKNFRLVEAPLHATGAAYWKEVIPPREDVLLQGVLPFDRHLVVLERKDGLTRIRIIPRDGGEEHYLDFGEPAYAVRLGDNPDTDTHVLRFVYTSLTTPTSTFDYDMDTHEKVLLKREEVMGGYDPADYVTERRWAPARDEVKVPISLVYRKGTPRDGSAPLLLYGYGSYGASMDARFNPAVLSLLERGFVYAIAHVRGGQELGRDWYEDGKLFRKMHTFTDFIDCAEFLVAEKYTNKDRLFAMGGSAGGLLMGAVVNMRPDLFKGVVARVPFVDVVTTMLDESIPLTTNEYDEWGNPNEKAYYDYMLSYSPYDNVKTQDYPNLLVTAGLHDSQVQYWEPAKWVAKLRARKTDRNLLLLWTHMEAGHGGASGRYRRHWETALAYAFLLHLAGRDR